MKIGFLDFFLFEDLATDVLNIQNQIAALQNKKAKTAKPIDDQLARLQQMLSVKQKMLADQKSKEANAAPNNTQRPQPSTQQTGTNPT